MQDGMRINALAGWFGSNRTLPDRVGRELGKLAWVGVMFAGGMCELPFIDANTGVVLDTHRDIINLACVVADDQLLIRMVRRLDRLLFHPDVLAAAQRRVIAARGEASGGLFGMGAAVPKPSEIPDVDRAADYFVCCWMGRGGFAGRTGELRQSLSVRWSASGGSSAKRWRSAVESLHAWKRVLQRFEFECADAFTAFARIKEPPDRPSGFYCDPPWKDAGEEYLFPFTDGQHRKLASECQRVSDLGFRVVIRYGDHPLIRGLYPAAKWRWIEQATTNQAGNAVNEVLITNGGIA